LRFEFTDGIDGTVKTLDFLSAAPPSLPPAFVVNTTEILVTWTSDSWYEGMGFQFAYQATGNLHSLLLSLMLINQAVRREII
jgi:hypothetical protein